jgi:hypothetical protein
MTRALLALLLVPILLPTAAASLEVAVDAREDRVYALTTGADGSAAPALSRPDGAGLPSLVLVNRTPTSATWASVALPPGVYRVTTSDGSVALVTVEPDPAIASLDAVARSVQNLTRRLQGFELASNATLRSLAREVDALERNVSALGHNLSTIRMDARAAKTAAEGVRLPADLARRDDVAAAERGTRAAVEDGREPMLYAIGALGLLLAAQCAGLGHALRRRAPRPAAPAAEVRESTPPKDDPAPPSPAYVFGYDEDADASLPAPATLAPASTPTQLASQETQRAPGPAASAEPGRAPPTAPPEGGGGGGLRETTAAASGLTAHSGASDASRLDGRVVSPSPSPNGSREVAA